MIKLLGSGEYCLLGYNVVLSFASQPTFQSGLYGVLPQKTVVFITTAVRTSDPIILGRIIDNNSLEVRWAAYVEA
jgi:hypothetical protein